MALGASWTASKPEDESTMDLNERIEVRGWQLTGGMRRAAAATPAHVLAAPPPQKRRPRRQPNWVQLWVSTAAAALAAAAAPVAAPVAAQLTVAPPCPSRPTPGQPIAAAPIIPLCALTYRKSPRLSTGVAVATGVLIFAARLEKLPVGQR